MNGVETKPLDFISVAPIRRSVRAGNAMKFASYVLIIELAKHKPDESKFNMNLLNSTLSLAH